MIFIWILNYENFQISSYTKYNKVVENNPRVLQEILNVSNNSKEKIENLQKEKSNILEKTEKHLNSNNLDNTLEVLKKNKTEYQKLVIVQSYIQNLLDIDNLRYWF